MTRYIQRHSAQSRVTHGIHMTATVVLILSGLVIFVPAIATAVGSDTVQLIKLGHRVFAVTFIVVPLISLILAPKGFVHLLKGIFAPWDADDKLFMKKFVKYLFSPKTTHMPKQHETKSGQRLADGTLVFFAIVIAITGVILWAGKFVSPDVFSITLLLHDISFVMISIVMLAHMYLGAGLFQPYRGIARVMFGDGLVSEADARYHWGHWADEELASGENVVVVDDEPLRAKERIA